MASEFAIDLLDAGYRVETNSPGSATVYVEPDGYFRSNSELLDIAQDHWMNLVEVQYEDGQLALRYMTLKAGWWTKYFENFGYCR